MSPSSANSSLVAPPSQPRRQRPCDACRKRKRRCILQPDQRLCQLCRAAGLPECTFTEPDHESAGQKRPAEAPLDGNLPKKLQPDSDGDARATRVIEDYDSLRGPSLLKRNLGLQQHRYLRYVGPSDELDSCLFDYCSFDERDESVLPDGASLRKVSADTLFLLTPYARTRMRKEEFDQVDAIEKLVAPNGKHLVNLFFEFIHPSFPVLDKKTFLEKYTRTPYEFSPPCLAGIYVLAVQRWNYNSQLSSQPKPDVEALESLAREALQSVLLRPKLSTLQGGILALQHKPTGQGSWALSCQMVGIAQELGVHLDCQSWRVPHWEKGLRRRLGWSIYVLDKWMALSHGRPSHILDDEWMLPDLSDDDFSERESGDGDTSRCLSYPFKHLASLTLIMSKIHRLFYSPKVTQKETSDPRPLLEAAKPVQIELKEWYQNLPHLDVHTESSLDRLDIPPTLHLAYFATEVMLHRAILESLTGRTCDPFIIEVCRNAARERVTGAIKLVKHFGIQKLQSFWYFLSGKALVMIGTFTALLYVTSRSTAEARGYHDLLNDYRWTLRTMSGSLSHFEYAVQRLDVSLSHFEHISPEDIVSGSGISSPTMQQEPGEAVASHTYDSGATTSALHGHSAAHSVNNEATPPADERIDPGLSQTADANIDILSQPINWVDISFPSPTFINGQSQDPLQWQHGFDFFGRDWARGSVFPLDTSEFDISNKSPEEI